ncbi:MAG: Rpn family recombination-promoting nuclease/putative transposase [Culicoidibacterales bacterium]
MENQKPVELLSPKVDFVFKLLFGTDENKSILIAFLNAILVDEPTIIDVTFRNTDLKKVTADDKYGILDVLATTEQGTLVNIEIQVRDEKHFEKRMMYYWSKLCWEQLNEGDSYAKIKKVISIAIIDFYFDVQPNYHTRARITTDDGRHICDVFEMHFVELKKLGEHIDANDQLAMWSAFIANPNNPELVKLEVDNPDLLRAKGALIQMSNDEEIRMQYHYRQKALHDEASQKEQAFEQGIEKTRMENAKNLLSLLDDEAIATAIGLTVEDVRKLRMEDKEY